MKIDAQKDTLYDQDFYEWTQRTAELLRKGRFAAADIEHVAEEISDMGKATGASSCPG